MAYISHIQNNIATFIIDRPHRKNAINDEVAAGLATFLDTVEVNKDIKFVVIRGAKGSFCSGGDLVQYHSLKTATDALPMLQQMATLLYRLQTLPMPVIAIVNGAAVGGGCEIATACDYRLVHRQVRAGFIQGTLAITTGWGGGTLLLEKNIQHDHFMKLLSEASLHHAEQLLSIGWATEIYDGNEEDALQQFIMKMDEIHPTVHRAYKEIAIRKWKKTSLHERMMEEVKRCAQLWEEEAHHLAVDQFLNKKK